MNPMNKTNKQLTAELGALEKRVSELEAIEKEWLFMKQDSSREINSYHQAAAYKEEAIYIIFDRKYEFVNEKFAHLFAIKPEEIYQPEFAPLSLIAPESHRPVTAKYREGIVAGPKAMKFEFTGLKSNGVKADCETFAWFIPYKWGVAMHGIVWDVKDCRSFFDQAIAHPRQVQQGSNLFQ